MKDKSKNTPANEPEAADTFCTPDPTPGQVVLVDPHLLKGDKARATTAHNTDAQKIQPPSGRPKVHRPTREETLKKLEPANQILTRDLEWARFVADEKILASKDRTKLKAYLDKLLQGLADRYLAPHTQPFPGSAELKRLTETVTVLGKVLGVKKADLGDLLLAMNRIENRWSKTPLNRFVDDLRNRLLKIPVCPLSVVHQASVQGPMNSGGLGEITDFLSSKIAPPHTDKCWAGWFEAIRALKFSPPALPFLPSADPYLVLMDLKRQQLEWDNTYSRAIQPAMQWIYLLLRQKDFDELTQVYCGDALPPEKVIEILAKWDNRKRRKASYRKTQARKRPRTNIRN